MALRQQARIQKTRAIFRRRGESAMSLVELLVSMVIIGIILAGTSEMVMINDSSITGIVNKIDSLNAARQLTERIGRDVREARNVGDIYGQIVPADGINQVEDTDYFPAPENPLYGGGETPTGGWPVAPWPTHGTPGYELSNTCLVVQVPVFDSNGFPTMITHGTGTPAAISNLDNVDTLVYQVVADTNNTGQWVIQEATFPGSSSSRPILNPPTTIMSGIIGPINPSTGQPRIFQYLDRADTTGKALDSIAPDQFGVTHSLTNITGVIINLEVQRSTIYDTRSTKSASVQNKPQSMGIRSEIFMRNNTLGTTSGSNT